jgi:hypothetical protein
MKTKINRRDAGGAKASIDRKIINSFWGMKCSRCGFFTEDETEAEDHINGPECRIEQKETKVTK